MQFALNRLDMSGPEAFAQSARVAEELGWDIGLLPCNPLKVPDPYVCLALAALQTTTLQLGTLLDTPVLRHPSVLAGSIATVAGLAPGRVSMGVGIGDTAVRFNGLAPSTISKLESSVVMMQGLLSSAQTGGVEVGAQRLARLNHAVDVPVWVAAQGPKSLRMAGRVADGVWIRVGTHPGNLHNAWQAVLAGVTESGRQPSDLKLGLIFHTAVSEIPEEGVQMGKAIAAGYYEYSRFLFDEPEIQWVGEDPEILRKAVYPDFHHHRDMVKAGNVVNFLPDKAADDFSLHGDWQTIKSQLEAVLDVDVPVDRVLLHPILPVGSSVNFARDAAAEIVNRI